MRARKNVTQESSIGAALRGEVTHNIKFNARARTTALPTERHGLLAGANYLKDTMNPEYIEQLADIADPNSLWRLSGIDQMDLSPDKRMQLDAGVALRRYASHMRRLNEVLQNRKSLLITPLSPNSSATKSIETPPEHKGLRG